MRPARTLNDLAATITLVWARPARIKLAKNTRVRIVITRGRA